MRAAGVVTGLVGRRTAPVLVVKVRRRIVPALHRPSLIVLRRRRRPEPSALVVVQVVLGLVRRWTAQVRRPIILPKAALLTRDGRTRWGIVEILRRSRAIKVVRTLVAVVEIILHRRRRSRCIHVHRWGRAAKVSLLTVVVVEIILRRWRA